MADADYADLVHAARRRPPRVALVLGSGLGGLADHIGTEAVLPYAQIPGMTAPSVDGHGGRLILGDWAGQRVLVFAGRLHRYEGHAWRRALQPVHLAHELGAQILLLTNAAGGIRTELTPGSLMLLRDHVDATAAGWWRCCAGLDAKRPSPYSAALFARLLAAARHTGAELAAGVYAQVTGPCYETKAEIRALRACGADAVGMSTAREADTAAALGMRGAAISCITNRAAGLCDGPIQHEEVLDAGTKFAQRLARLIGQFLAMLDQPVATALIDEAHGRSAATRQTTLPGSSATSKAPSAATATPTGRP
jgi:purine-nucleoside phosphorylase